MIIYKNKGFETRNDIPEDDWTGNALFVVNDDSELADKIKTLYPFYDFVTDEHENLIDVVETEKPIEPVVSAQQREQEYRSNPLIEWQGENITVDQANTVYLQYSAEGSPKAIEIQGLIVDAKESIRQMYPEEAK